MNMVARTSNAVRLTVTTASKKKSWIGYENIFTNIKANKKNLEIVCRKGNDVEEQCWDISGQEGTEEPSAESELDGNFAFIFADTLFSDVVLS